VHDPDADTPLPFEAPIVIELLLASPQHRYEGRPADGALPVLGDETPSSVEVRAGLGIVGDRYFAKRAHRHASVTVIASEALDDVAALLARDHLDPAKTRRNIVLRGVDADALRDVVFSIDSGAGPVVFRGNRPANPCAWMDQELAPGAFRAMRGRGGMRCEPLTSGTLAVGQAVLRASAPVARAGAAAGAS
jgi:MOSC domain-containing protein YiiM